jgi:hypothetical protein
MSNDFLTRGLELVRRGFRIIPILPGSKRPAGKKWQNTVATESAVRRWAEHGAANLGILTELTPAVDIDIYDEAIADRMEKWILDNIPGAVDAPRRVGQPPKRLLTFRAATPFRKVQYEVFDPKTGDTPKTAQRHKVEVLGVGQQFVAYGIHPDTHKPYNWTSLDEPLTLDAADLPVLTHQQAIAIVAEFERLCMELGWKKISGSASTALTRVDDDDDGDFADLNIKAPSNAKPDEIRAALKYVSTESYDGWLEVGMALHHQFSGGEEGLELWDEWSQASSAYDADEIAAKWESFNETPEGRTPITVATIFKHANDAKTKEDDEKFARALNLIRTATDPNVLFKDTIKHVAAAVTSELQFDFAAKKLQDRAKELTGASPRIDTVRKALSNARGKKTFSTNAMPDWCEGWVYIENGDRFFHLDTKQEMTERGFNAKFDRELISDEDRAMGVAAPDAHAAQKALNVYHIPTVYSTVYLPGHDRLVEVDGRKRANTFDESSIPKAKKPETKEEHEAIRLIEQHFRLLLPDPYERSILMDYLSYNVQFPAEKITWAILIYGAEGTGKTFLMKMMQMALGHQNIGPLPARALRDDKNGWAEGYKMLFIEEVRLHGSDRYEIFENMKEPVSNEDIQIRRMNRDYYQIPNVTNYLAYTNHGDALPAARKSRRWCVLSTQLLTPEEVISFNEQYPDYFETLFATISEHAAVIRGWLMTREISASFAPKRHAPETYARLRMNDVAEMSDEMDALMRLLETADRPDVTPLLLTVDALQQCADIENVVLPTGKALAHLVGKIGYLPLGLLRLDDEAPRTRCFTKLPGRYPRGREEEFARKLLNGQAIPQQRAPLLSHDEDDEWN